MGTFLWSSPISGSLYNYVELTPSWMPNVGTAYYDIFLNVSISYAGNVTFNNMSTFPNFDPTTRTSSTPEVTGMTNSIIGWTYSDDFTNLALTYPSSTQAFSFSYISSYLCL